MHIFNCDPKWPICLFDFTYKNKVPNYFCYRIDYDLTTLVIDDYFSERTTMEAKRLQLRQDLI